MYWYISFLRPPPISVSLSGSGVTITPQIANDLRTETRFEPTEIHYVWQRTAPLRGDSSAAEHLTTYAPPGSTYRPVTVALPKTAKTGERWRLGLFHAANADAGPSSVSLLSLSGAEPPLLGVWSEPIEITGIPPTTKGSRGPPSEGERPAKKQKGKEKESSDAPKQTRIQREWALEDDHTLKIIEQTSFDLDKKVWDSGIALSSWLWRRLTGSSEDVDGVHESARRVVDWLQQSTEPGRRILELGSGTGLVSIALRSLYALSDPAGRPAIVTTDLKSALQLMEENIELNTATASMQKLEDTDLQASELDWDQLLPAWVKAAPPHLIIAADVTYNTAVFPAFVKTLVGLLDLKHPNGHRPMILLAYKERDPGERELWKMFKEKGVGFVLVDKVRGAENEGQVEIWVGGRDVKTEQC